MSDETLALIIDTGSAVTKAGFAGSETPKVRFPTLVASLFIFNLVLPKYFTPLQF